MLSGVPQDSVLGPLLFLIYINGVTSIPTSPDTQKSLFADDFLLYKPISAHCDLDSLQEDVDAVEQWSHDNHLTLNPTKCKCMLIFRRRCAALHNTSLHRNGHSLEQVMTLKYLGVTLSSDLSWSHHINRICRKDRVFCTDVSIQTLIRRL